uniref:Uncharacterized protein n=1 Tax=Rhizophora mucronata TaxID=61149 RepID=A0A2P2N946_RHIMU
MAPCLPVASQVYPASALELTDHSLMALVSNFYVQCMQVMANAETGH